MSALPARSAVFLEEMGIGARWTLRDRVPQAVDAPMEPNDGVPGVLAGPSMPAVGASVAPAPPAAAPAPLVQAGAPAGEAPAATVPVASPPAESTGTTPVAPPSVESVAAGPAAPPQAGRLAVAAAATTAIAPAAAVTPALAPAPASPAPAPAPAPSGQASQPPADESTAWFDDAPAPVRPAPVGDDAIAAMDWAALRAAVSTCTRCALCGTRRRAVNGRGPARAAWIAIAAAPSRLDEKEGRAVAGEAGQLLDNMLKAIALQPADDVYVAQLVKCRPANPDGTDRAPNADELAACRPYLHRELALSGAAMALTFGQFAAKGLMPGPAARGKVMRYGDAGLPVVATYHPDDLLRKPEDKAKAWGDLCLAKAAHDQSEPQSRP